MSDFDANVDLKETVYLLMKRVERLEKTIANYQCENQGSDTRDLNCYLDTINVEDKDIEAIVHFSLCDVIKTILEKNKGVPIKYNGNMLVILEFAHNWSQFEHKHSCYITSSIHKKIIARFKLWKENQSSDVVLLYMQKIFLINEKNTESIYHYLKKSAYNADKHVSIK